MAHQHAAQALARSCRFDKEGADAARLAGRVEQRVRPALGAVGTVQGGALAPAAAGQHGAVALDDEIRPVGNELRIDAKHVACHGLGLFLRIKARAQCHAGTGDQCIHGGHIGRQRLAQARQSAKAEPGTRDAPLFHLICCHQFLRGNTVRRVAMHDLVVDHQLAASDAVEQLRLRPAGGETRRETGTDLRAARGQQGVRVLELLRIIGVDGQQGGHVVGVVGVQLGLDHRRGRNACIVDKHHGAPVVMWLESCKA